MLRLKGSSRVRAAVIAMQKDEAPILPVWLSYYKRLVGPKNIFIIDNGSDDERMKAILKGAAADGVTVTYRPGRETFDQKGPVVQELARQLVDHDVILPLDADEFLGVVDGDRPDCRPDAVHAELARFLEANKGIGCIRTAFVNVPGTTLVERKECRKVIMKPQARRPLSKGYHFPPKFANGAETALCHVHFHKRGSAEEMRRSALLKLPEGIEQMDIATYTKEGHHMKWFLNMTEEQYRSRFKTDSGIDVSAIFAELGHPVPYSTWSEPAS